MNITLTSKCGHSGTYPVYVSAGSVRTLEEKAQAMREGAAQNVCRSCYAQAVAQVEAKRHAEQVAFLAQKVRPVQPTRTGARCKVCGDEATMNASRGAACAEHYDSLSA